MQASNFLENLLLVNQILKDPGSAGVLSYAKSGGLVEIVTAGAEARTLPLPERVGQIMGLYMKTDGGDATITCSAAINQTGNTVITMNDAGDFIILCGIKSGSNLRWRVVVNDGCVLS